MRAKVLGAAVAAMVGGWAGGASAAPITIDFDPPAGEPVYGPVIEKDYYKVTNNYGTSDAYLNWLTIGLPDRNANGTDATVVQNAPGTTNTLLSTVDAPFSFYGIGLADGANTDAGGQVEFRFFHTNGLQDTATVTLAQVTGLQSFTFAENDLAAVSFTATTTQGPYLQFDNVIVSAVPLPATAPLFGVALAVLGVIGFGTRRKALAV